MRYVYLIESINCPHQRYVGMTCDLRQRLKDHHSGNCEHTAKYAPWREVVAIRFQDDSRAAAFERYLKSGSGRALAKRHFHPA